MTSALTRTRAVHYTPRYGLSGLDGALGDLQALMVAPGMLAGWAMRASLRGARIAFFGHHTRDAPFTGTTGLTTAHVNGREARLRMISVQTTLPMAGMVSYVRAQPSCGLQTLHGPVLCLRMAEPGPNIHLYAPTAAHAPMKLGASAHVCAGLVWEDSRSHKINVHHRASRLRLFQKTCPA